MRRSPQRLAPRTISALLLLATGPACDESGVPADNLALDTEGFVTDSAAAEDFATETATDEGLTALDGSTGDMSADPWGADALEGDADPQAGFPFPIPSFPHPPQFPFPGGPTDPDLPGETGRGGYWDGETGEIGMTWVYLPAWWPHTIETRNCTSNADPVLHLFDTDDREVAAADGGGNVSTLAKLDYTPTSSGWFRVLSRAADNDSHGHCDLFLNGTEHEIDVPIGGFFVELPGLRSEEILETVRLPGGAEEQHYLMLFEADGVHTDTLSFSGGTAGAARIFLLGAKGSRLAMAAPVAGATPGQVRVVRNDLIDDHDFDEDGLGRELEKALGTCSALSPSADGFDCNLAADRRDTDGDGISDGLEVFGRRDVTPPQPLALWGADPRHKDVFVEVDFRMDSPSDADRLFSADDVRQFADYYEARLPQLSGLRAAYNAATLINPDGLPGISVHMDTGLAPTDPADLTLYGDWGGHNMVPAMWNGTAWGGAPSGQSWGPNMGSPDYFVGGRRERSGTEAWVYGVNERFRA